MNPSTTEHPRVPDRSGGVESLSNRPFEKPPFARFSTWLSVSSARHPKSPPALKVRIGNKPIAKHAKYPVPPCEPQ